MHRLLCAYNPAVQLSGFVRWSTSSISAVKKYEDEQRKLEEEVDTRKVLFATASSIDNRPRIAALEAFDVASSALPRPANFCFLTVSLDLETMIDAPEVVWKALKNKTTLPNTHMIAMTVSKQRFQGGFLQVTLGNIPDLECDVFTLDSIPSKEMMDRPDVPPVFASVACIDANLAIQHEHVINQHLLTIKSLIKESPLIGTVTHPVSKKLKLVGTNSNDSVTFFNDKVFEGSAVACLLRSRMVNAQTISTAPSIELKKVVCSEISYICDGRYRVGKLNGIKATDVIRGTYEEYLTLCPNSKVFLGILLGKNVYPLSFTGNPEEGYIEVVCYLRAIEDGCEGYLVCDDADLDMEASAGALLKLVEKEKIASVEKTITVARESRKFVTTSSCFGLHFTNGLQNQVAKRDDVIILGGCSTPIFVPPLMTRCIGRECAVGGFFSPAQVVEISGTPLICPRAASNTVFFGQE